MYRSSGLLIYAALVDLLAEDFLREGHTMSKRQKILGFCYVLMGGMSPLFEPTFVLHLLTDMHSRGNVDCRRLRVSRGSEPLP